MRTTRKDFIKTSAILVGGAVLATPLVHAGVDAFNKTTAEPFTLPKLDFSYDALEPFFDTKTMEIHYTKHHQAYVTKLNEAVAKEAVLKGKSLEELLAMVNNIPASVKDAVRNNAGGHWNHTFFWSILRPRMQPSPALIKLINKNFGSLDQFKTQFEKAALGQFGSGWAWVIKQNNKLLITSTANQDNPLMGVAEVVKGTPILGLDVWEHAYYLRYQNKRADYIKAFWNIVNWQKVEQLATK